MTTIEHFTKKRLNDITEREDTIDIEYRARMENISCKEDLFSLLDDYQEFLPSGLQKFRGCSDEEFGELIFHIRRIYNMATREGKMPAEPTEAVVMVSPPILSRVRVAAIILSRQLKQKITWGTAFFDFKLNGNLQNMLDNQEKLYKHIIDIKPRFDAAVEALSGVTKH